MTDRIGPRGHGIENPRTSIDEPVDMADPERLPDTSAARPVQGAEHLTIAPDGRPTHEQPAWRKDFPIDWPAGPVRGAP